MAAAAAWGVAAWRSLHNIASTLCTLDWSLAGKGDASPLLAATPAAHQARTAWCTAKLTWVALPFPWYMGVERSEGCGRWQCLDSSPESACALLELVTTVANCQTR